MAADETQLESLKQVAEWCRTLITIDTAAIAAIGVFVKLDDKPTAIASFGFASSVAVLAFVISIVLTVWMLVSIPTSIQDIQPGNSIWDRDAIFLHLKLRKWKLAYLQMLFFVLGVSAFSVAIVVKLLAG